MKAKMKINTIKKSNNKIEEETVEDYMDFTIPEDLNTLDEKVGYVKKKINTAFELSANDNNKDNIIKWEWIIGKWFNKLKHITKGEKGLFGRLVKKYYPKLSDKHREWLMKLAKKINIKQYPALACLDKKQLVTLIQIAEDKSVKKMLDDNNIKVDIHVNSGKQLKRFKDKIDNLIEIKTIPKKIKAACETLEKYADIIIENPKAIKDNPEIIEASQAMVKKFKSIIALKNKNLLE